MWKPFKNHIYCNGKVPLVKCLKKVTIAGERTQQNISSISLNISFVINFPHKETYLSRAREQGNLTLIETFIPSEVSPSQNTLRMLLSEKFQISLNSLALHK